MAAGQLAGMLSGFSGSPSFSSEAKSEAGLTVDTSLNVGDFNSGSVVTNYAGGSSRIDSEFESTSKKGTPLQNDLQSIVIFGSVVVGLAIVAGAIAKR